MSLPAKGRRYHHGDLREALIVGAIGQVEVVGLEHLSLRCIATEVGVSPSAAYHHFADKDALLAAVALDGVEKLNISMSAAMAAVPPGIGASAQTQAQARATAAGLAYVTFAVDHPNLFRLAFSGHCPRRSPNGDRERNPLIDELFDDLVATGVIPENLREGSEEVMWSTVHGMATLVLEGIFEFSDVPTYLAALARMMRLRD
ncbi:MAG: TetR family transcriptional regulator [Actinobacteria bacterium]|uniref:Unannotated protein n=1 Tax=freshwater metagenome TaxID=449393 RepID=A0A6J7ES13_9ZZZZ|nr:TetR family transcriptional regulator [Actinomycetota bacterium]